MPEPAPPPPPPPPGGKPLELVLSLGHSRLTLAAALNMWLDQACIGDRLLIHDPMASLDASSLDALLQLDDRFGRLDTPGTAPARAIHWHSDAVLASKDPMLLRQPMPQR